MSAGVRHRVTGDLASILVTISCLISSGCDRGTASVTPDIKATLSLVDESGEPVSNATVSFLGHTTQANRHGQAKLVLGRPTVLRISAPGFLDEVAILGWESDGKKIPVRLLRDLDGRRVVLHFGGDVMFGRRYLAPTEGAPLIEAGYEAQGAKAVVSDLAEAFRAADLGVVNLETVASHLTDRLAYPGKRFLLQSPPEALNALPFMGVHVVGLANNHVRDWLEPGLEDTLQAVDAAGLLRVGAGLTEQEATAPLVVEVGALRIGFLAFTSVTNNSVNDALPREGQAPPDDLEPERRWMYESRLWGIELEGWTVEHALRMPGDAWRLFKDAEPNLSLQDRASAWSSLSAVYPELQDLVARRGHGGAALWTATTSLDQVSKLAQSTDLTVVLLHTGYELSPIVAESAREMAAAAIKAGASLVVAHHPHVLQGLEWKGEALFAHSLGNLVFDQTLMATFDTAVLRVVIEDQHILEARWLPVSITDFRPLPIADAPAMNIWRRQLENSVSSWSSVRDTQTDNVVTLAKRLEPPSLGFRSEWGTARILREPRQESMDLRMEAESTTRLSQSHLWPARLGLPKASLADILIGRDLLGYGNFEPVVATDSPPTALHWTLDHDDEEIVTENSSTSRAHLRLSRSEKNQSLLLCRPVARMSLPRHRLYAPAKDGGAEPLEPEPIYSVRLRLRGTPSATAFVRIDFSGFDITDLTSSPESVSLGRTELPIERIPAQWEVRELPVALPKGKETLVNMAMLYLTLAPPSSGEATLEVDDISFVEWRNASQMPAVWGAYTHVRSAQSTSVQVEAIPLGP